MFRPILLAALLSAAVNLHAAMLHALVQNPDGEALAGVNVRLKNGSVGGATDIDGRVNLHHVPPGAHTFLVSSLGYQDLEVEFIFDVTTVVEPVLILKPEALALQELTVKGEHPDGVDLTGVAPVDRLGKQELAASYGGGGVLQLMGEVSGVDCKPCALCGSAGVSMQGLDPSYTEIKIDGMPVLSGVGALYGLESIRTEGLEGVEVERGATRSTQGASAMAGTVNLVRSQVSEKDTTALRLSIGDAMRQEVGLSLERRPGGLPTRILLNWSADPERMDRDGDHLTDAPQQQRFNINLDQELVFKEIGLRWSLKAMDEHRFAGDVNWEDSDRGSSTVYGREIDIQRAEGSFAAAWEAGSDRSWSLGAALVQHQQDSWYGATPFDAVQRKGVASLSVEQQLERSSLRLEAGFTWEAYSDNLDLDVKTDRTDRVPHLAISAKRVFSEQVQVETGLRLEHHADEGAVPLLRANLRWEPITGWILHAGAGQGWRTVNIFSLDKAVHAGFDAVQLDSELVPESSVSLQASISRVVTGSVFRQQSTLRVYATEFRDKAVLRYSEAAGITEYTNADEAYSRGFLLSHSLRSYSGWKVEADFSRTHMRYLQGGLWWETHMVNRWTSSFSLAKSWVNSRVWSKIKVFGPQKLPEGRSRDESPIWNTLDLGASKRIGRWDLALMLDNALDYTQPDEAFVHSEDGSFLDSAMIYGPLSGRRLRFQVSTGW